MNRIKVRLVDKDYVVVTEREEDFVRACAQKVNYEVTGILTSGGGVRIPDAALLCALNFLDGQEQLRLACDDLKKQLKECFEEGAALRAQVTELEKSIRKMADELAVRDAKLAALEKDAAQAQGPEKQ